LARDAQPTVAVADTSPLNYLIQIEQEALHVNPELGFLGLGEREAIQLFEEIEADVLLVDERLARRVATERGIHVSGTLGVLRDAHRMGWIDGVDSYALLKARTTFRRSSRLEEEFFASLR
jgi:predicted nucleic acid-binding protein